MRKCYKHKTVEIITQSLSNLNLPRYNGHENDFHQTVRERFERNHPNKKVDVFVNCLHLTSKPDDKLRHTGMHHSVVRGLLDSGLITCRHRSFSMGSRVFCNRRAHIFRILIIITVTPSVLSLILRLMMVSVLY